LKLSSTKPIADDPAIIDELHKILARENRSSAPVHEHDFGYASGHYGRYECKHCGKTKDELGIAGLSGFELFEKLPHDREHCPVCKAGFVFVGQ
jgi:hypothetical protein